MSGSEAIGCCMVFHAFLVHAILDEVSEVARSRALKSDGGRTPSIQAPPRSSLQFVPFYWRSILSMEFIPEVRCASRGQRGHIGET